MGFALCFMMCTAMLRSASQHNRLTSTKGKTHTTKGLGCSAGYMTHFAMLPSYFAEYTMCFTMYLDCAAVLTLYSAASQHILQRGWEGSAHQGWHRRWGILTQLTHHKGQGCWDGVLRHGLEAAWQSLSGLPILELYLLSKYIDSLTSVKSQVSTVVSECCAIKNTSQIQFCLILTTVVLS